MRYFHIKLELGQNFKLLEPLILAKLSDGLPSELKQFLVTKPPSTTIQWISLTSKLIKNLSDDLQEKNNNICLNYFETGK